MPSRTLIIICVMQTLCRDCTEKNHAFFENFVTAIHIFGRARLLLVTCLQIVTCEISLNSRVDDGDCNRETAPGKCPRVGWQGDASLVRRLDRCDKPAEGTHGNSDRAIILDGHRLLAKGTRIAAIGDEAQLVLSCTKKA